MESAKLSDVKDGLSRYVEKVRKGGTVRILVRGVAVADLVPVVADDDEVIAEKELLTPGPKVKGPPPSEAIVAERRRR
jgi:antitoxin (DNA-binding transcriptional repressor) of toxin-antitoxin stability system